MMVRWLVAATVLVLLSGCAAWTLVSPQPQSIAGGRYTVTPQSAWSRLKQGRIEVWTIDGMALQALRFFDPIEDGSTMFPVYGEQKLPTFSSRMTETGIQEFVVHSIERAGGVQVKATGLRPWRFGAWDGFRFELEFLNPSGLEMSGIVTGARAGDQLMLITYTGARAHYFPKYAAQVERLLGSIQSPV